MIKPPNISDAEWQVMEVLWRRSPLTAAEVVDALANESNWNPRTIKTLLARLVKKKALAYEPVGNRYHYRPRVSREQCVHEETQSFLHRIFRGAAGPMLAHFTSEARLTPEEIDELKRILTEKSRRK